MVPPSPHTSGKIYRYEDESTEVEAMPELLLEALTIPRARTLVPTAIEARRYPTAAETWDLHALPESSVGPG